MTVRVGVNLMWLVPGVVGGSEEATLGALRAAAPLVADAGIELVAFGRPALTEAHPDLASLVEVRTLDLARGGKVRRVLAESTELPRIAAASGLSLMHHAGGVVPFGSRGPVSLAIHDTQPLDLPHNFSMVKRRYLSAMIPRSVRRAAMVTAPSEFVRSRLVDDVGADPAKVAVVPWSVPPPVAIDDATREAVRRRHRLPGRYVLYPAIAYAHKNHLTLLDAVAAVRRDGGASVELVLTGAPGPLDDAFAARAARADLAGAVHVLGRVPAPDLAVILDDAAVVAVPSRYEGFGLPALEALAAGRPAVVAEAGSLPEVTAGAALVVGPDDVAGWASALRAALDDDATRSRLVAAGPAVAASWSPERTATALIDVWQRCLAPTPRPAREPS